MCYVDMFCLLPLEIGCLFIGFGTFFLSILLSSFSIVLLAFEGRTPNEGGYYMKMVTHLDLTPASVKIILSSYLVIEVLWTCFSVILIFGLWKNKASCVLSYFLYGIVMTIVYMLSGLLLLLQSHWAMAVGVSVFSMFYIYCLVAVHNTYELMMSGKILNWTRNRPDDEELLDPLSEDNV